MTIITTKRHPIKFHLTLFLVVLFCFGFGSVLLLIGVDKIQGVQPTPKEYFMPVAGIALYILTFLFVSSYLKNSPQIIIDNDKIHIGEETYSLKDIKDIILTGKMPFKFIVKHPMEGMAIFFNDGSEKFLFDDMYSNSSELKSVLQKLVLNKHNSGKEFSNYSINNTILQENTVVFKGNQFISFRGISLWGLIVFLAILTIWKWQSASIQLFALAGIILFSWFALNSYLMHYFILTKDLLIVRNHNFTWKEKVYYLDDIEEIVFETQGMQPNCMRIVTKDFKSKLYPSSTLNDSSWINLKNKLEAKGINVRNECINE